MVVNWKAILKEISARAERDTYFIGYRGHSAFVACGVNGGAKLVHPGGAKLVHLTLCGTRCWGGCPGSPWEGPALLRVALALRGAKQRGRFLWTHRVNHCTGG